MTDPSQRSAAVGEFDRLADLLEQLLDGGERARIVEACRDGRPGLMRLRLELTRDSLPGRLGGQGFSAAVRDLERRTQSDGFHVLRDWDGRARRFVDDSVSVAMLDYAARLHEVTRRDSAGSAAAASAGIVGPDWARTVGLLIDHYALFLIALLTLRSWDGDDPEAALARVERLLGLLQSEAGSGHRFVAGPESLMWIAVSNYHPDDDAYNRLLGKVRGLGEAWQLRFAENGAHMLGIHLRWGLEAYYRRDYDLLRNDNVADYPWLLWCVAKLMERWDALAGAPSTPSAGASTADSEAGLSSSDERRRLALAMLNGISADPPGFTFEVPPAFEPFADERALFVERYASHHEALRAWFSDLRPTAEFYSPLAFHFNFPHNAMKAAFAMRLAGIPVPRLPIDALFEEERGEGPRSDGGDGPGALAAALTRYSQANPEQIRDRQVMVLSYNVPAGLRTYRAALLARPEPDEPEAESAGAGVAEG